MSLRGAHDVAIPSGLAQITNKEIAAPVPELVRKDVLFNFMKVLIIGGHMTPALAVIESLPKDNEIVYVGRKYALEGDSAVSLEYQTVTKRNIPFIAFTTGRLQRKLTKHTLLSFFKIPRGFQQSLSLLLQQKPDVVVGFFPKRKLY